MDNVPPTQQAILDAEHLRLLTIFQYIYAGISALFGCIPFIHLAVGIGLIAFGDKSGRSSNAPPAFMGWLFVGFALIFIVIGWTQAILVFLAGRYIAARKHHTYCFVIACLECLCIPFGTILGVFTIIVLNRPGVKPLFPRAA